MKLKIASYNLWNHPAKQLNRLEAASRELNRLHADVIALQEVPAVLPSGESFDSFFRDRTDYPHIVHFRYPGPPEPGVLAEGLAFLSKWPFVEVNVGWANGRRTDNNWAVTARLRIDDRLFSVTNVHLDWFSLQSRQKGLGTILDDIPRGLPADMKIMCGDFNDDAPLFKLLESPDIDNNGYWCDVAALFHKGTGQTPSPTLDPRTNPRWSNNPSAERPTRVDRIYIHSTNMGDEFQVLSAGLFGNKSGTESRLVPSDHYGVCAEVELVS